MYVSANGGTIQSKYRIEVEIGCGESVKLQSLSVVDIRLPLILGLDWLNANNCGVQFVDNTVQLQMPNQPPVLCIQPEKEVIQPQLRNLKKKYPVIAEEHMKLKAGYVTAIRVKTKTPPTIALVGHFNGNRGSLFSPPAIIGLNSNFLLGLSNLDNKQIKIKKGRVLGYVRWSARSLLEYDVPAPINSIIPVYQPLEVAKMPNPLEEQSEAATKDISPEVHFDLRDLKSRVCDKDYQRVRNMLLKYRNVWDPDQPLTSTKLVKMKIDLIDNKPLYLSPYNTSPEGRAYVIEACKKMELDGVIQKSVSPWGSPILLVPKVDGTWRFCIDFRRMNKNTIADAYPLPRMEEILQRAGGHKWYTAVDERSGYWQIQVAEEDRPKTAFVTPDGHYEWLRMPFGLINAPATFQRLTDALLAGIKWQYCAGYLDDIVIWSDTFEDHLQHVEEIFSRMARAKIQLRAPKCNLFQREVKCLGSIVNEKGISMDPKRVKAMQELPVPTNKDMLRSALGTLGYYQKFIPFFAIIANPLTRMTREKNLFEWGPEAQAAYDALKQAILKNAVLAIPKADVPYILDTDACAEGIAAVLSQVENGIERPIIFLSRKLKDTETRTHPQVERELLAIIWATDKLQHYLTSKFILRSDCRSLTWIYAQTKGRLGRWAALLSRFTFDFVHREGKKHGNVDGLSRVPLPAEGPNLSLEHYADAAACLLWQDHQETILTQELLDKHWMKDELVKDFFEGDKSIERRHQRFYKAGTSLIYIPKSLRSLVLYQSHDTSGAHAGQNKTLSRINTKFWWPSMKAAVVAYVDSCLHCKRVKAGKERSQGLLRPIRVKSAWDIVGIDLFGPLPRTSEGSKFVMVMIDHTTKFVIAEPTEFVNGEAIVRFLDKYFSIFGYPRALLSDRGPQFIGWVVKEFCQRKGVAKIFTTAYHPQGDGVAEAFMKFLGNGIKALSLQMPTAWDTLVSRICWAHRTSIHPSIGDTPFHAMFGRDPVDPTHGLTREIIDWRSMEDCNLKDRLEVIRTTQSKIVESFTAAQDRVAEKANKRREETDIKIGDLVLKRLHRVKKLDPRWSEPCRVVEVYWNSKVLYIQNTITGRRETINVENVRRVNERLCETEITEFRRELLGREEEISMLENEVEEDEEDLSIGKKRRREPVVGEAKSGQANVQNEALTLGQGVEEIVISSGTSGSSEGSSLGIEELNATPSEVVKPVSKYGSKIWQEDEESDEEEGAIPLTEVETPVACSSTSARRSRKLSLDRFIDDRPIPDLPDSGSSSTSLDEEPPLREEDPRICRGANK